jgi:phenylacetate-CoA ligase
VPLSDVYSAEEVGYVALQCPQHEHYHVQSESLFVEILDERGRACAPGQVGRVVVTDLHNFATPLVRYEIGDYAEVGAPCDCGRGLPVLSRIAGRVRNMLLTADGKRFWPLLGTRKFVGVAPVLQSQIAQRDYDLLEARLVTARPLDASQEARLRELILAAMPPGMRLAFVYCDAIPRGAGGKFEDFVCEIPSAGAR